MNKLTIQFEQRLLNLTTIQRLSNGSSSRTIYIRAGKIISPHLEYFHNQPRLFKTLNHE